MDDRKFDKATTVASDWALNAIKESARLKLHAALE
jgi:hypothetical protein